LTKGFWSTKSLGKRLALTQGLQKASFIKEKFSQHGCTLTKGVCLKPTSGSCCETKQYGFLGGFLWIFLEILMLILILKINILLI